MKKTVKFSVVIALMSALLFSMTACSFSFSDFLSKLFPDSSTEHVHVWGDWQRNETEHWRVCSTCREEQREAHSGEPCSVCAYGFRVLAFGFTEGGDPAHADFAQEAIEWFPAQGKELGFTFDFAGTDYSKLNDENLENYELVMFFNDRPHDDAPKAAFEKFMKNGGAWMGFHACAFSMEGNNEHWDWYQDEFLGCGDYKNNTWDPTSEPFTIETYDHWATKNFDPDKAISDLEKFRLQYQDDAYWQDYELEENTFLSAPCEWYGWMSDLFANEDITVLLTMNPTPENPAGDDPRAGMDYQIWTQGKYPIAWVNNNYNMIYMNWGHNLQSYDLGKEGTESSTFSREAQNQFMLDGMYGIVQDSLNG